jgi:hypothetical protein
VGAGAFSLAELVSQYTLIAKSLREELLMPVGSGPSREYLLTLVSQNIYEEK